MNKLKFLPLVILSLLSVLFFKSFIFQGNLPIPSDTIVGLYYPFRDAYFKTNPNGLPYKNFLITDPVRQQYPWRKISFDQIKNFNLPLWNPYNFSGTPLLANFQSAVFYPFNILFFLLPFEISWSILIFLQPLLAGIFLYYYLNNLKIKKLASLVGAFSFSFSGFFIAWLEWGTVLHTALWLPLVLLSIDRIFAQKNKITFKNLNFFLWPLVFVFSLVSSFFAGHLQTFFYLAIFSLIYFVVRFIQHGKNLKTFSVFAFLGLLFTLFVSIQLFLTLKFIDLSARSVDLPSFREAGWFIPWQNLIQFVVPDFFGNPSTLNYYGIWNYAEFIGYIGIFPLILAVFALIFRRDKKTLFFGVMLFLSLILAFPTLIAKIPFKFEFPFLSTSQPTRLLFIVDFCLAVLSAFGLDYFLRIKNKKVIIPILSIFALIIISLWGFVIFSGTSFITFENLSVAKQNLIFPTLIFLAVSIILIFSVFNKKEKIFSRSVLSLCLFLLILITIFDLFRFGWKFTPFTNKEYLYPLTQVTNFLQNQKGQFRIMSVDSRIMPPNFSIMYKLQTLDGYDPLYLKRFGEFMAATGRGAPDIKTPFGFYRIITPQNAFSRNIDMLGVKYILSLNDLNEKKLKQVFSDGTIRVYENLNVFPRSFFVNNTLLVNSKEEAINALFDINYQLNSRAVVEEKEDKRLFKDKWGIGDVAISSYQDNKVSLETKNSEAGFLVLTDSYYPSWHATIDGKETKIYITNYNYRGIIVPKGNHKIEFFITL